MFNFQIKKYRLNSNMSISDLANRMQVSESEIIDFEKGHAIPDFNQVKLMSELFNIPLSKFILDSGFLAFPNRNPRKIGLLLLIVVSLLMSILCYFVLINNHFNWLWSILVFIFVYMLLLYNVPLGLEELSQEWRFEDDGIVFMEINTSKIFLPFILLNKNNYFKKILYSNIAKIETIPFKKDARIDNTLAFGPYSPRLHPSLQAFSLIKVIEKTGSETILRSRNENLLEFVKHIVY